MKLHPMLLLIFSLLVANCKEPFPTYEEPKNVLTVSMRRTSGDTLYIVKDDKGNPLGSDYMKLKVFVRNDYPQLLQGAVLIKGRINVNVIAPLLKIGVPVTLSRSNITRPPVFQDNIAITPGDTAEFNADWLPAFVGTTMFDGIAHSQTMLADSTIVDTYSPLTFQVDAEVQVFERVQAIRSTTITFGETFVVLTIKSKP